VAFRAAVEQALDGLRDRTGLGCWLLLRAAGDGWVVVAARDRHYGVGVDAGLADGELPVRAMLEGRGPRVAPALAEVDAYAATDRFRGLPVGAFAGVPILAPDGTLLGCLCGLDPAPTRQEGSGGPPEWSPGRSDLAGELPTIELLGRLLASLLAMELDRQELQWRSSGPSWTRSPTRSPASATAAPGTGSSMPRRHAAGATARRPRWSPSTWTS
jgi:GAF domain-containing protein